MADYRFSLRATCGFVLATLALSAALPEGAPAQTPDKRPMTFLDGLKMKRAGGVTPSPDGVWALYTVTTPNWDEANQQSDIHLVSLEEGVASSRQMTYTDDKNETSPQWSRDGRFFVFLSNRDAPIREGRAAQGGGQGFGPRRGGDGPRNQLYMMRPDGGEARRITDEGAGVSDFAFSRDGRWLVYRSGRGSDAQLYRLAVEEITSAEAEQLTEERAGVQRWEWAPDRGAVLELFRLPVAPRPGDAVLQLANEALMRCRHFSIIRLYATESFEVVLDHRLNAVLS